jgi:GT2 family glycosyltransferase/2-polyprenyl-3-methyl-5-hydroxy-6-metoxy-1,4-benzoquinol methylase
MRAAGLTVAIPTRDRWEILQRTLAALQAQTAVGFETIVVCDGDDQRPPAGVRATPSTRLLAQPRAGPGVARNLAAAASDRPLLLFLGDDMIPAPDLISRHLDRHALDPAPEAAVLGRVRWHPEVPDSRLMRWLEWSGAQFDYRRLDREALEGHGEAGFGRFYSCNVSIKRSLFMDAGGFDPEFPFDYEDLDLGWRLHQRGMRLIYEPRAIALHLHAHDWSSVRRRYESRARAERVMVAKHPWFSPWFYDRMHSHSAQPPVSRLWPALVELVPDRAGSLRERVQAKADRSYHQRLAPAFLTAWEGDRDLEELQAYLGDAYDHAKLAGHRHLVDAEANAVADEPRFYRTSELYLYDLTAFSMSGAKDPYRRQLQSLLAPGSSVLDYGCGIGSDGLRLLEAGYRVTFADFDSPSTRYLRWRLARRGLHAELHDLDAGVPDGFDAAYAFDVIEHVRDPFEFLAELERRARIVVVNLLEPVPGDTPLHRPLAVAAILAHATRRGLLRHRRYHGRSHLIAYRSARRPGPEAGLRSAAERWLGPHRQRD